MPFTFKNLEGKTVLIADHEVDYCLLIREYFIRKGSKAFIAHEIRSALKMIKEHKVDLVLITGWVANEKNIAEQVLKANPDVGLIIREKDVLYNCSDFI